MGRGVKSAKGKAKGAVRTRAGAKTRAKTKPRVVGKSRKSEGSGVRAVGKRLAEALEQHAATSEILHVISASPSDVQPVLDAVAERAARLCEAPFARVLLVDGDLLRTMAQYSVDRKSQARTTPVALGRTSINGRAVVDRATVHHADVVPLLESEYPDARQNALRLGFRAVLSVPLIREGKAYGAIFLWRREPGLFSREQVALVQTFAEQAAIAVGNVRLFRATEEALEQQTATSEILRVISQSPTDVQPVFDTIVAAALSLCRAHSATVFTFDGKLLRVGARAIANPSPDGFDAIRPLYPRAAGCDSASGRAVLTRRMVAIPDVLEDAEYTIKEAAIAGGFRSALSVPLLSAGNPIGALNVGRTEPGPFPREQIALLQTFADQAVIAIENVRLFNETKEALERQTATAEVLRVISESPTDEQPVMDAVARRAGILCRADGSRVWRVVDGRLRAMTSYGPAYQAMTGDEYLPLARTTVGGRCALEQRTIHVEDIVSVIDSEYPDVREIQQRYGFRTVLNVPLLREGEALGVISLLRKEVLPFTPAEIGLVQTFADQAVIAIENVRLFNETKEALDQQTATAEILQAISSSPGNLQPVLEALVHAAARFCGASDVVITRPHGEILRVAAALGTFADAMACAAGSIEAVEVPLRRGSVSGRAFLERRMIHIDDLAAESEDDYPDGLALQRQFGHRTMVATPLLREGEAIGVISLHRMEVKPFSDKQLRLLRVFADQAVIAIENVRLFHELEVRNRDLSEALERQTATSEILRVISRSPNDVRPVFETIVASAARLCGAESSAAYRFEGEMAHFVVGHNFSRETLDAYGRLFPCPLRETDHLQRVLNGSVLNIPDFAKDPHTSARLGNAYRTRGVHSTVLVPMVREGQAIGAIAVSHRDVGAFSPERVELLKTFADQAVIAIENVRLFTELEARNRDLTEALEQQTATAEILQVISGSHTDPQPVFDTIVRNAARLCDGMFANVLRFDGERLHFVATSNSEPDFLKLVQSQYPMLPDASRVAGRVILGKSVVVMEDALSDPNYTRAVAIAGRWRRMLGVPMMHAGEPLGVIAVGWAEPGPVLKAHEELLKTFADQAVIAIENVRLFTELEARNRQLTEALEHQTATSEILRVISSSPTDAQPVFDIIGERAKKLCDAQIGVVSRVEGERVYLAAVDGLTAEGTEAIRRYYPHPIDAGSLSARAIRARSVVHLTDVLADPEYDAKEQARAGGWRNALAVPMLREGQVIGAIFVGRTNPGRFADTKVELLKTFADQAVIAIENVRLFTELEKRNRDLSEALEQQTATSEILRVISRSPTDVQPVFDTIAAAALRLCNATSAVVTRFDGELIRVAALANVTPEGAEAVRGRYPRPPGRYNAASRAVLTRSLVAIPDVLEDPEYEVRTPLLTAGFRSVVAVPLMREGNPMGAITVVRPESGPFPDKQIALLQTFADQAVIAIENVRLFRELEARTSELTRSVDELRALGEVGQAVSSTLDLETVLSTIASRATQLAGMGGGAIHEYDEAREEFHLRTTNNLPDELVEALQAAPIPKGEGAVGQMAVTREPVQFRDIVDAMSYQSRVREILLRYGYRSLLAVPLLREDHLLGGLVVIRKSAGAFDPQVIELLKTFATQSALAIQNARLFREIEDKSRQLAIASQHKSDFLANMSHELRTPLNAIIGFSEVLAEKMFGEINDKQAEYLSDILESGRHLLSLINDILDLSKIEAGRMELEATEFDLPSAIENTLILVRERAQRRGIALGRTVDERLGTIRADERKVKQVLLNLLSNALKFTPEGGRIDVRAMMNDGAAEISVTDTGVGIAPEDQAAVFEEFRQVGTAAKKVEGTGLGLAISRKFIELHGGSIGVKSQVGAGSTFTFTLPLPTGKGSRATGAHG